MNGATDDATVAATIAATDALTVARLQQKVLFNAILSARNKRARGHRALMG